MASDPTNPYGIVLLSDHLPEHSVSVVKLRGVEALSQPFRFDLTLRVHGGEALVIEELLGAPAALVLWHGGETVRTLQGVLSHVEIEPATGAGTALYHARVRFVPRLALLRRNRNSRIFQDRSTADILRQVLSDSQVAVDFRLARTYAPRGYCVQYEESDLAFVTRLAAEEGWFYYLSFADDPRGSATVVFCDDGQLLSPIAGEPALRFHDSGGIVEQEGDVTRFQLRRRVREQSSLLRAYDWLRPSLDLSASVETRLSGPEGPLDPALLAQRSPPGSYVQVTNTPIAGVPRPAAASSALPRPDDTPLHRHYEHHLQYEGQPWDAAIAGQALQQKRRRAATATGEARSRRLVPGRWVELSASPIGAQNQRYVLTRVEHAGGEPSGPNPLGGSPGETYRNRFTCVPVEAALRPPRPARRVQQVVETATVVGPPGHEIHTDSMGRIKVQFHWDRQGVRNEHSSMWIRVMQAWAGSGWGFQFIPRVGMEVVVSFLGGDMDRPMVLGAVYNAERAVPFQLPREKTKSGIRTESTRGGHGYNELSFEDRKGYEKVYVHAEKDLEATVEHNLTARVGANLVEHVSGGRFAIIGGNRLESVGGNITTTVAGEDHHTVEGTRTLHVGGHTTTVHQKGLHVEAHKEVRSSFGEGHHHTTAGSMSLHVGQDLTVRTGGSLTTVVGTSAAPRSIATHVEGQSSLSASQEITLHAGAAITLTCGDSHVRIAPKSIEISSESVLVRAGNATIALKDDKVKVSASGLIGLKSDDKVALFGSGAHAVMAAEAKIGGGNVKLGAPDSSWSDDEAQEGELTTIEVVDEEGHPVPNERFRIRLDGGKEISGVLDADGKAKLRFDGEGELELPDVGRVESA